MGNFNSKYDLTKVYSNFKELNPNNNNFATILINNTDVSNPVKFNNFSKFNTPVNNFSFTKINNLAYVIINSNFDSLYLSCIISK